MSDQQVRHRGEPSTRLVEVSVNRFRSLVLAVTFVTLAAGFSSASDIYIAQNAGGANTGADCADAHAASWFNSSSNWGSGGGQIGPGTTVHLCGTFTSQMNGQGSGSSGSPITVLFESGGQISVPFCPSNGCMNFNGLSWITIDGGTACGPGTSCNSSLSGTGSITNTANGTGMANHLPSQAIYCLSCNHVEIRNLLIQNLYVHTSVNDSTVDQTQVNCVFVSGSNISVHDSTMHDAGWCLIDSFQKGDATVSFYNIDVHNIDHGYVLSGPASSISAGPFYFYNNHIYGFSNWDTTSNDYHHDGIHCFSGSSSGQTISGGWYVYNNTFGAHGYSSGANINSFIYIEGSTGPPCANNSSSIYLFNNIFLIDHYSTAGHMGLFSGKPVAYNNTLISTDSNSSGTCWTNSGAYGGIGTATMQNNAIGNCFIVVSYTPGSWVSGSSNNNIYGYTSGNTGSDFYCNGQTSFSGWKSCIGGAGDASSSAQSSINVSTTTGMPNSGSPVIGAGTNLHSLCSGQPNPGLGALCLDAAGVARPSSGAWDVGAYVFNNGDATPTGLVATVH
jgi:hypothetical protein